MRSKWQPFIWIYFKVLKKALKCLKFRIIVFSVEMLLDHGNKSNVSNVALRLDILLSNLVTLSYLVILSNPGYP